MLLMLSFLVQAATGLGRTFMETPWGQTLCSLFGGYESARVVHINVGLLMIVGFAVHILYLLARLNWRNLKTSLFGPDSMLPRPKDVGDFFRHLGWMVGARAHPEFERWGYWEKFDYWAVFWGMVIIGLTGLMLAYPLFTSRYIPGWGLNVAFWVHRIEAVLAIAHVFLIHFFIGHLRRRNFPMDHAMFEGSVPADEAGHERPAWVGRLQEEGKLAGMLVADAQPARKAVQYVVGYLAIGAGLFLLIGALLHVRAVTW
jgi:cytochrome b subunit of formate dehydrogenase